MLLLEFLFWFVIVLFSLYIILQIILNICLLPWQSRHRKNYEEREEDFINNQRDEWLRENTNYKASKNSPFQNKELYEIKDSISIKF